ncbi:tetratricopeptide repeat protein [Streptomyces virginiae]|uniref:tetratricopeptide repeat protein n=1 Tax=Streptomyces virginiae TaxID=1961 RepID=UPI0036CFD659
MTGKPGRKWRDLPPTTAPEVRRLSEFLRARVDESGKTLNDLAPAVQNASSVISTYLGGKIPTQRFVTALIAATAPAGLREKHTVEALRLLEAALHPPRRPAAGSTQSGSVSGATVNIAAVQAQHLETYAHLTRALEQHNELRQAAANSEKLVWVLYGMIGKLQERVTHLVEERDRLGEGSEATQRKLTRALGQKDRANSELARARQKQREAEELASRLQAKIDHLTGELDRLRPDAQLPDPVGVPAEAVSASEDPEGDDIEAALARAGAVNDNDSHTVARITTELAENADVVPNNPATRPYGPNDEVGDQRETRGPLADIVTAWGQGLSPNPANRFAFQHERARMIGRAGEPQKARDLLADLVGDSTRFLGPDHPSTLTMRHNHARWTGEAGNPQTARDLFADLVTDRACVLGPDHPSTLTTRYEHAQRTGEAGDPREAHNLLADLIADSARSLGPDHSSTLTTRYEHAHWTGEAGDRQKARDLLADLIADSTRALGPDHPGTLTTRHGHAHWTGEAGDRQKARDLLAGLIADSTRALGPDYPGTRTARRALTRWES